MGKRHQDRVAVTESTGNVFADLGLPEPEEELARRRSPVTSRFGRRRAVGRTVAFARYARPTPDQTTGR